MTNDRLLKHVIYEMKMLYYTYGVQNNAPIISSSSPNEMESIRDALYTSFLLHFRNLYYFFNDRHYSDDIKISTFVKDGKDIAGYEFTDKDLEVHINKCLAHLTKDRLKFEGAPEFDFRYMALSIISRCVTFFDYILRHDIAKSHVSEIRELRDTFSTFLSS